MHNIGRDSSSAQLISHICPSAEYVFLVIIAINPVQDLIFSLQFVFHAESQGL